MIFQNLDLRINFEIYTAMNMIFNHNVVCKIIEFIKCLRIDK